jgi:hypothetical protein
MGLMLRPKEHQETPDGILGGSSIVPDLALKTNSAPKGNQIPTIQFVASVSPTALYLLTKRFLWRGI